MTDAPSALIPALAAACAKWFPEMDGRFIAVSEIEPFDNASDVPTLPIGFVALVSETGTQGNTGGLINISDDVMVHFAFTPVKYKNAEGLDTPFFAYYDYEPIRDKLLSYTQAWRSPRNMGLQYRGMAVEATPLAVYITFRFTVAGKWCQPDEFAAKPIDFTIIANTKSVALTKPCAPACAPQPDPCEPARTANPHGKENRGDE